jgi:hypothetical protein
MSAGRILASKCTAGDHERLQFLLECLKIAELREGIRLQPDKNKSVIWRSSIDGELACCVLTSHAPEVCCQLRLPGEALKLPNPKT